MVHLQSYQLLALSLFTALILCGAHDSFYGYNYLPPKPHVAPIFTQQGYNQRNGFQVKLSLPMSNYFQPNILESIVSVRSEYMPIPITLTKHYSNGNHIARQKILQQQNNDLNTITTEIYKDNIKPTANEFNKGKGKDNKYDKNEDEDYTEATTEYDYLSTTEDYEDIANRVAPEVVASLLG